MWVNTEMIIFLIHLEMENRCFCLNITKIEPNFWSLLCHDVMAVGHNGFPDCQELFASKWKRAS